VAPREALVVLYQAMRAKLHRRIRMVIEFQQTYCIFFIVN
jgi:hypothetical protein